MENSEHEERFELNLASVMEFALAGGVVWLVLFTVASWMFGWF